MKPALTLEARLLDALAPFKDMPDGAKIVIYYARGFQYREVDSEQVEAIRTALSEAVQP